MASRTYHLDNIGEILIVKSRRSKNLRISLGSSGKIRVSIPSWAPYAAGIAFANSKQDWIIQNRQAYRPLRHGQTIGKGLILEFHQADIDKPKKSLIDSRIIVCLPKRSSIEDEDIQLFARKTAIQALRIQAEEMLLRRLSEVSEKTGLNYSSATVRILKGRWGSCDSTSKITLNIYLVQLPWELIDYVILHELVHTRVMKHGPEFWAELNKYTDQDAKQLRNRLNSYQPHIG